MTDLVDISGGTSGPARQPADGTGPLQLGLTAAVALIVGSLIGAGLFKLPASLAFCGPITLISTALLFARRAISSPCRFSPRPW
jgi:hypothetical protein